MKMKFTLVAALMFASVASFAQLSFGVKAGLNLSTATQKFGGEKVDDIKMKPGFNLGLIADYSISDLLAVETGLTVENKGFKMKEEEKFFGIKTESKMTTNLFYATIPVDIRLNFSKLYVLVGPYFGVAVAGKVKTTVKADGEKETESEKLEFGNDELESDMKRMDVGLGFGAGYELNDNLGLRLGYDLGLSNLLPGGDKDNSMKNGSLNISATYKF